MKSLPVLSVIFAKLPLAKYWFHSNNVFLMLWKVSYNLHSWIPIQRKWLDRLAKQVHEVVLDEQFINDLPAFPGGVKQLEKVLNNQLDSALNELREHLWEIG